MKSARRRQEEGPVPVTPQKPGWQRAVVDILVDALQAFAGLQGVTYSRHQLNNQALGDEM